MVPAIDTAVQVLQAYLARREVIGPSAIDRPEVVAHATLSGYLHHWPERAQEEWRRLINETLEIKTTERSRWAVQRRIAIAKLARILTP